MDTINVAEVINHDNLDVEYKEGAMVIVLYSNMEPAIFRGENNHWKQMSKEELRAMVQLLEILNFKK